MQLKRIFVIEHSERRENTFYLLTSTLYVCFVYSLTGMRKCQSSWLGTKWTWKVREKCHPMKAEPLLKSGVAPLWRLLLKVKQWWTNSLQKLWGKWTMPRSLTKMTHAVPHVTYNSIQTWLSWTGFAPCHRRYKHRLLDCGVCRMCGVIYSEIAALIQNSAVIVSWHLWVTLGVSNYSFHHSPQSPVCTCNFKA